MLPRWIINRCYPKNSFILQKSQISAIYEIMKCVLITVSSQEGENELLKANIIKQCVQVTELLSSQATSMLWSYCYFNNVKRKLKSKSDFTILIPMSWCLILRDAFTNSWQNMTYLFSFNWKTNLTIIFSLFLLHNRYLITYTFVFEFELRL